MIRTFIYGSCVSRDTFERLDENRFTLTRYVARQSIISAMSPPSAHALPPIDTESAFQRRMIEGDWTKSLITELEAHAASIDLVLWDLCDERLGVRQLQSAHAAQGTYVTRSVDSLRSGMDAQLHGSHLVAFGSRRHRLLFLRGIRRFDALLRALGLHQKLIVLAPAWASHTLSGRPSPASFDLTPQRANRIYHDYHFAISHTMGVRVLQIPSSFVMSDQHHPWGPAPFHYTESVYRNLTNAVDAWVRSRSY